MVWFAPYKQIGIVFTLNNNNNNKPLQSAAFKKFRDVIMGKVHIRTLMSKINPMQNKERVGT